MNTIHFGDKYTESLLEGFRQKSYTESSFSHELDLEFSGARTVHVLDLLTEPLQDYDRNGDLDAGSRFGATKEVGDHEQTFTMTQDKSLSLAVDKGNNLEQFNVKRAGSIMAAERDEHIVPELDRYRLNQWAKKAGIHKELSAAPDKTNIVSHIVSLHNDMLNADVPEDGGTLFIQRAYLPTLKLSSEWSCLDSLGGKSLPSGAIGMIDGLAVKPVPTSRFPSGCYFMIVHRGAVIAPMKINSFKGHTDPPGLSGDLLEFRMLYDAFVLAKKCCGVAVACAKGTVCAAPAISLSGKTATLTCATSGATIYYTLDGSDPRYTENRRTYTAAIALADGDRLQAYSEKSGLFESALAQAE